MSRVDVVILGAVIVVMGCATTQKEEPQPTSAPRLSRSSDRPAAPPPRTHAMPVDARSPASELGRALAERAQELGVSGSVAFVWGDISPVPPNARRVEIVAGGASLPGYLVPDAHEVDMGQLASGIHNVVMVGCDGRGLYGSHPSGPGRQHIDFTTSDARTQAEAEELFAFVSIMPGDVAEAVTSGQVVSLLQQLPTRVRYAVMALPS